jgi:hypothetical protein
MPYLTFETDDGRDKLRSAIEVAESRTRDNENSKDKNLIQEYFRPQELGLHVLRTLYQFHYYTLPPVDVSRQSHYCDSLMVGQLWLWVIDESMLSKLPPRAWNLTITL